MPKKPILIEQQIVDRSGKIIMVRVIDDRPTIESRRSTPVPSLIGIASAASGNVSIEVSDDLVIGAGVRSGDRISVRFLVGLASSRYLDLDGVQESLAAMLGGSIKIEGDEILWSFIMKFDREKLDLFELSASILSIIDPQHDADYTSISFIVESYISELNYRIGNLSEEEQRNLASSSATSSIDLGALLYLGKPSIQILVIANPRTPSNAIRRMAETGPSVLEVSKRGTATKINNKIRNLATREIIDRERRARRR